MRQNIIKRSVSVLLSLLIVAGTTAASITASAAVLPDGYEKDFEENGTTYQSLGILEDQYDLIEPINDRFPVISPSSLYDKAYPPLFTGTYEEVEDYFRENGMTDGLPVVPPTKIKAEKFLGYSAYDFNDVVATVNGKKVKAYQVAANAIMAGCSPEHLPVCIAFTEALGNKTYLDSLRSGRLTPMMYVNGPVARQIGIDNTQGMTTEESNYSIGRFMELALINFAGIKRTNAFGSVQPLVFSENDEICLGIGWQPHHVEKGYKLNDNVITAGSFSMWGNNVTPATDLPEEIMKVIAWDITEKNLGALGGASIEDNADTRRLIFITESVATALATKYKTKSDLENALIENARRPLWMRAYAYYYSNAENASGSSLEAVYDQLKAAETEDAKETASPAWMNGITYANIETVATMTKGNTDIIVTGDSSRNKTQVIPGGVTVSKKIKISSDWDRLVTSVNYFPLDTFMLTETDNTVTPPTDLNSVLPDGTYRIMISADLSRSGRVYFDTATNTLQYYASGQQNTVTKVLDSEKDKNLIAYLTMLGANSSFTVKNGKFSDIVLRFSTIAQKLNKNIVSLTDASFSGINLTLHANNTSQSLTAGGLAKDGASVTVSDTVRSFTVELDGDITLGESANPSFVKLSGTKVTVDPTVPAGARAILGVANSNGTYRTLTFVNGGDGTYTITYNTANTLSLSSSALYLEGTFNNWKTTDAFEKTDNDDIVVMKKELSAGNYEFKLFNSGTNEYFGSSNTINNSAYRIGLTASSPNCKLNVSGGTYEFKYELSTKKLFVYKSAEISFPVSPLENNSTISTNEVYAGESVTVTGAAAGGKAPYQYAFLYKSSTDTSFSALQNYSSASSVTVKLDTPGTYTFVSRIKDSEDSVKGKNFTVMVKEAEIVALENKSILSSEMITLGESVTVNAKATGGTAPYTYGVYYKKATSSTWSTVQSYDTNATIKVTPATATTYDICVKVKDKSGTIVKQYFTLSVNSAPLTNVSTLSADTVTLGESVTVNAKATGGTAPYTYGVYYKKATSSTWSTVQSYNTNATIKITPAISTTYDICVKVKDKSGTIVKQYFTLNVNGDALTNVSTLSSDTVMLGESVTVKAKATGGTGNYSYAVYYKKKTSDTWSTVQAYNTNSTIKVTPGAVTDYDICVKAKDSKGTISKVYFTVTVMSGPLTNNSTLSATSIKLGSSVTVNAKATGGTGTYTYGVFYKKATSSTWSTVQSYAKNQTIKVTPATATVYDICVKVKDKNGTISKLYFTLTVAK